MAITRDEVERLAALARIALDAERLPALTAHLDRILDHVAVLAEVDVTGAPAVAGAGTAALPLRPDIGPPIPLERPLAAFAPEVRDGFVLVPRLATHDEDAE